MADTDCGAIAAISMHNAAAMMRVRRMAGGSGRVSVVECQSTHSRVEQSAVASGESDSSTKTPTQTNTKQSKQKQHNSKGREEQCMNIFLSVWLHFCSCVVVVVG